jgi:hypothetical protein
VGSGGIAWYTSPLDASDITKLAGALAADGISLRNPSTQHVTLLSREHGHEGEQVVVEPGALSDMLAGLREPITFQLWLDDSTDVLVNFRRLDEWIVQQYSFDGLTRDERERVVGCVARCSAAEWVVTFGLVVDRVTKWPDDFDYDRTIRSAAQQAPCEGPVVFVRVAR